jgi:hypothetical protein
MEWKNVNGIWFRVEGIGITFWQKKMMRAIFDVIVGDPEVNTILKK